MRILVLTHEYPPIGGGGGRVAQDLCQGFAKNGHEVRVLTTALNDIQTEQDPLGFSIERIHSGRREAFRADMRAMCGYVLFGFWEARKIIENWNPDLIHVHFAVPAGLIAWLLSKMYGIPYVLTAHLGDVPGGAPAKTDDWFRWIFPFTPPIWRRAARVVAVSEYTRQLALEKYPIDIDVIPNGVDTQQLIPAVLNQNDVPQIIFAGRFMEQKNPLQLVRVLAKLGDLPWDCVMCGDGPLMDVVKKEIFDNQLSTRIQLLGWIGPKDVLKEFSKSDILFMPSRSEGLPVVGVQALASGLAIVAGNSGGFVDLVIHGENGFLFDPDDTKGMQQGLQKYLEDPELLLNARMNSVSVVENFDLNAIVSSYVHLFQEVIQE